MNILIVEDEIIIAEDIKLSLEDLGYKVIDIVCDYPSALAHIESGLVDMALIDIKIDGHKSGIDIAEYIRKEQNMPVIFLTSHTDDETLDRAKKVFPEGYLIKPPGIRELRVGIELAISNFFGNHQESNPRSIFANDISSTDRIFFRDGSRFVKLKFSSINYIKSSGNYMEVFTESKTHILRSTLKEILDYLPADLFIQIHKSCVINIECIDIIDNRMVHLKNTKLPIGRNYLSGIRKKLSINL
jgi:DNA-binding LytR/AlgR family response regulator